jgi:hypothetical protein
MNRVEVSNLRSDMPKINAQLLQQRRLTIIPLRPKRCQPAGPQPTLLAHSPTHAGSSSHAEGRSGATRDAIAWVCGSGVGWGAVTAIGSLRGSGVAGDVAGGGVGGGVELEVLGGGGGWGLGVVGLVVVLGHGGLGGENCAQE